MHRQRPMATPARSGNRFPDPHVRAPLRPPDRPLVPYMRFSRKMWPRVRAENPEVQLLEIGKIIGQMWRESSDGEKAVYQQEYEHEKLEYDRNLKAYQAAVEHQQIQASRNVSQGGGGAAKVHGAHHNLPPTATIQPVDEEDPFEMTRKRQSAARYDRNNRLMVELFSGVCVPDTRTIVPQHRIDMLKKQATSLSSHQKKLNEELERLEENFQRRKRALEENSETFNEGIKKLKDERPLFTEDKYREYVHQWMEYIRTEYAEHKAKLANSGPDESAVATPAPVSQQMDEQKDEVEAEKSPIEKQGVVQESRSLDVEMGEPEKQPDLNSNQLPSNQESSAPTADVPVEDQHEEQTNQEAANSDENPDAI